MEDVTDRSSSRFPIIVEEKYVKDDMEEAKMEPPSEEGSPEDQSHLYVLIHGMGGTHADMRLIMNEIALIKPKSKFLLSQCNPKKKTFGNIADMGKRLAKEVKDYMRSNDEDEPIHRISFIGFSLGGVILRSALPLLEVYKSLFHGFVTLSSPHLGFLSHSSTMVKSGIWLMEKFMENQMLK